MEPSATETVCFSVLTSRQKSLSPDAVDEVTWVEVLARLGGMRELTFTSTGMVVSPALMGKVKAFRVMLPAPNGSLHSTSVEASPLQDTSLTPAAETSALNVADGTSSSTAPVPFKVVVAPVWINGGCKSSTFACVLASPQSAQVTAKVPACTSSSCFSVLTSRQKSLSPDAVDEVTWVEVLARLGGMREHIFINSASTLQSRCGSSLDQWWLQVIHLCMCARITAISPGHCQSARLHLKFLLLGVDIKAEKLVTRCSGRSDMGGGLGKTWRDERAHLHINRDGGLTSFDREGQGLQGDAASTQWQLTFHIRGSIPT